MSPLLLLALASGCGGRVPIAAVSGKVTLGGHPLAGAVVTFQPIREPAAATIAASGSVGHTDSDGRYELRLIEPNSLGAAVGMHRVTITTATADPTNDAQLASGERVPLGWRDGSQTFDVPAGGTSEANFSIP
jgi:hypothetical protein